MARASFYKFRVPRNLPDFSFGFQAAHRCHTFTHACIEQAASLRRLHDSTDQAFDVVTHIDAPVAHHVLGLSLQRFLFPPEIIDTS
jgi:hypothetical protein